MNGIESAGEGEAGDDEGHSLIQVDNGVLDLAEGLLPVHRAQQDEGFEVPAAVKDKEGDGDLAA